MGKAVLNAPLKPNEPMKKGETKKSFLSNTGKALQLQGTPARQVFTPRAVNVGALIYSDPDADVKGTRMEELEFTKPTYKYGECSSCHKSPTTQLLLTNKEQNSIYKWDRVLFPYEDIYWKWL